MKRAPYYFCRYERTDEIKREGRPGRAPVYVWRLKREGAALMLLEHEAWAIRSAMTEEGQPTLLPEAEAIEGKEIGP